jgi:fatty acid desaturase
VSVSRPFFRYSAYDVIPAVGGLANVAFIFWTFLWFDRLSWWALVPAFFVLAWFYCWNLQCISHNFIHNPFFSSLWLNRVYSVLETWAIGVPQVLYHHYHMNHHWGDSDAKGPDGSTRDWSSIYRYSRDQAPEPFWRYCLVSFWRVEVGPLYRTVVRAGRGHIIQTLVELAALGLLWAVMGWVNWRYFAYFYLPSYYLGWILSYAEGYLEHYGCEPGNPFANSVSSYNRPYNFLWLNNGYHQEHHWDPKTHWTRMRQLREQIRAQLQANGTRILRGPHITALLEDLLSKWRTGRRAPVRDDQHRRAA